MAHSHQWTHGTVTWHTRVRLKSFRHFYAMRQPHWANSKSIISHQSQSCLLRCSAPLRPAPQLSWLAAFAACLQPWPAALLPYLTALPLLMAPLALSVLSPPLQVA